MVGRRSARGGGRGPGGHEPPRRADTAPTCPDIINGPTLPATKWLDAPGTLIGIPGRDFLVGSTGSDTIEGLGGDDVICTEPFGGLPGAPDSVDGGSGRDRILGVGHLKGGSGGDTVFNFAGSPTIDCGSADDLVYANGATDVRRCEGTL